MHVGSTVMAEATEMSTIAVLKPEVFRWLVLPKGKVGLVYVGIFLVVFRDVVLARDRRSSFRRLPSWMIYFLSQWSISRY